MEKFSVILSDLDTLQSRLWDFCKDKGEHWHFKIHPAKSSVSVWNKDKIIAEIQIIDVDEPYEIIDKLLQI